MVLTPDLTFNHGLMMTSQHQTYDMGGTIRYGEYETARIPINLTTSFIERGTSVSVNLLLKQESIQKRSLT